MDFGERKRRLFERSEFLRFRGNRIIAASKRHPVVFLFVPFFFLHSKKAKLPLEVIHHQSQYAVVSDRMGVDDSAVGRIRITVPGRSGYIFHSNLPVGKVV